MGLLPLVPLALLDVEGATLLLTNQDPQALLWQVVAGMLAQILLPDLSGDYLYFYIKIFNLNQIHIFQLKLIIHSKLSIKHLI